MRLALVVALALFCQACGQSGTGASEGAATGANLTPLQRGTVGVEAAYSTQSDWGSGFVGQIVLTNKGTSKVTDWQVEFDLAANIDSIWNAKILSHTGQHYVLGAQSYNNSLTAGQSVTLGFQGSPGLKGATAQGLTVTGEGGSAPPAASPSPTPRPSASPAAPTPSPSPAAPAASPSPAASTGSLTFVKDDDWGSGFTAHITLTNQGTSTITDWQIEADWDRNITNVWNGALVSSGSGKVRFGPASYNRSVAPGASISVGFQGNPGSIGSGPSALRLVGGTTTTPSATPTPTPGSSPTPTPNPSPAAPSPSPTATPTPVPTATGWFHTQGSDIVDANGNVVRITGVNWFGLETSNYTPHGLWSRNLDDMVAQMSQNGYNTMRVPYCNQMFDAGSTPNSINYSLNPELQGKSALQILDALVASAGKHNMRIILDRHRPDSGGQSELWYTSRYSEERWISDWEMLATRYKNNPTVIGCDLHNEPHGSATWGDGNAATDWRAAAERCGNRILAANPNLLILVEGIERVNGDNYWWGGNLMLAGSKPVNLNVAGRVVYSPHDYPSTVYNQSWFSASNYPNNLDGVWDTHWGYLLKNKTAPVLLGEFGTKYETNSDKLWLQRLVGYLSAQKGSFTYWSWNPNSGDTGGILKDDWKTINTEKQAVLQPILAPKL